MARVCCSVLQCFVCCSVLYVVAVFVCGAICEYTFEYVCTGVHYSYTHTYVHVHVYGWAVVHVRVRERASG